MKDGDLAGRTVVPVQQVGVGLGAAPPSSDLVFARLSNLEPSANQPIAPAASKEMQSRKIAPALPSAPQPLVFVPATTLQQKAGGGLFQRVATFFGLTPQESAPQPLPVRFASRPATEPGPAGEPQLETKLEQSMDRFEKSQKFAVGTALASSLTQSVMSSSRRLTQGQ